MNFKRKKPKQQVKCTLCTTHRWKGNSADRFKDRTEEPEEWTDSNGKSLWDWNDQVAIPPTNNPKKTVALIYKKPGMIEGVWWTLRRYRTVRAAEQARDVYKKREYYKDWTWKILEKHEDHQ